MRPLATFSWITFQCQVFSWDKYTFSDSLGCKLTENYDGFENSSLFFQRIVKQSKKVRHSTCLETNFILILNFPQISTKYPPKNQKRTIIYEFKQFWWIFNILYVLCLCLFIIQSLISFWRTLKIFFERRTLTMFPPTSFPTNKMKRNDTSLGI